MEEEEGVIVVGRAVPIPYQGTVAPIAPHWSLAVGRTMASFRPDVVHVHEPLLPSTSAVATLRSSAPVVATFHAQAERSALFDVAAPLLRLLWRKVCVRVAVSEAARSFLSSRLDGEVRVIPNGVDVGLFAGALPATKLPGGKRVAWVGRLDRQKGFPVAVEAFERLAAEIDDVHLIVAGDGRDRTAVDRLSPRVRNRVIMLGAVPHSDLPPYLAACDAFIAPATGQESFGVVLVEAMASGLPVVATDIAGYREVLRREIDGLLVLPGDALALADGLRRVLDDAALAERLRQAGRARANDFSWDVVVTRLERAYGDALATGGRGDRC